MTYEEMKAHAARIVEALKKAGDPLQIMFDDDAGNMLVVSLDVA